jgi:hypothetical protein
MNPFRAPVLRSGRHHLPPRAPSVAAVAAVAVPLAVITPGPGLLAQAKAASCPWLNTSLSVSQRVQMLMSSMTLANEIDMAEGHGTTFTAWVGDSSALANLPLTGTFAVNGSGSGGGTTAAQAWQPQSSGSLLNPQSGKCLDGTGFGGSGTQAQIWSCTGGANQQWTLP